MNKRLLISIFTLFIAPIVFGQNPLITNYTIADGLPSNKIFCVLQDNDGFMWFGTNAGVIRSDGNYYKHYTTKDGLSYNSTVRMKEDMEGRIWCLNTDGSVNYISNNQVFNESNTPFLGEIKTNFYYYDFYQDRDSTIYLFNGEGGVSIIKGNKYLDFTSTYSDGSLIFNISKSENNNFIFWENKRIVERSPIDKIVAVHPLDFIIKRVISLEDGHSYVCDLTGNIHLYKGTELQVRDYIKTDSENINDILVTGEYTWVSTFDNGLYCFEKDSLIFHQKLLKIQNLVLDDYGNIWTGSNSYGVFKINTNILKYPTISNDRFNGKAVRGIAASNDNFIWLTNGESIYALNEGELFERQLPFGQNILDKLYQLPDNTLLISGTNTPLYFTKNITVDKKDNNITFDKPERTPIQIKKFIPDVVHSKVYFYLNDDLFFLEHEKNFVQHRLNSDWGRIRNAFMNYRNDFVINGSSNYVIADNKVDTETVYSQFNGKWIVSNATLDSTSEVLQIEDADDTELMLIRNEESFNLLPDLTNLIDLKLEDLISYKNTLFLFTVKTVYFISDPLNAISGDAVDINRLNIEFNNINNLFCHDDKLYVASDDGLTIIPVSECENTDPVPTKPYVSKVLLDDEEVSLNEEGISYRNKDRLNIEFSSLNFSSSPANYAYMLEGVNNDWITGTANQVVYLNLKPGEYTFKLKSRKNMEPYSEVIELPIVVVPTFYQLLITKIVAILILLFLGFLVVRSYYRRQLLVREKDNQLVTLENRALQSMMNPHFIFNSLGSIQKFLLQNKAEEAGTYLSQFARLIRQTMNSIKSNSVLLEDEVDRLRNYIELERVRMENRFEFAIVIDQKLEEDDYNIPSMIVQPFVENAIWHGISQLENNGKITIRFNYLNEKSLEIVIEDNGIGFEKSKAFSRTKDHLNMASTLTQKRIQLIGEKYRIKTKIEYEELYPGEVNPGAKITLLVPIVN
ncbi:histidine kinase [Draconibacterium sp. IB214405]|uniref:histidine kinase n=1 Tax=Draconibacterium sp. IB214405 TaxID=3097352 RepID=UPI002A135F2F|nr:histidine kinase [Draconibacterium sp. IB214405]MDX8338206.1 histidine kinase [Draconibacterium sp. IB214405]